MTNEEAIQVFQDHINTADGGCHCKYCEACRVGIAALKLTIPTFTLEREYIAHEYDDQPYLTIRCPNCDMAIGESSSKRFCEYCGQSLLWGDE